MNGRQTGGNGVVSLGVWSRAYQELYWNLFERECGMTVNSRRSSSPSPVLSPLN